MATFTTLSGEETRQTGFTHKIRLTATDISSLTTTVAASIFPKFSAATTIPAGTRVKDLAVRIDTAAAHADTVVFTIGDGGDVDRYLASVSMKSAAYLEAPLTTKCYTYGSADTIDIIVTVGSGACSTITAVDMTVFLSLASIATL